MANTYGGDNCTEVANNLKNELGSNLNHRVDKVVDTSSRNTSIGCGREVCNDSAEVTADSQGTLPVQDNSRP